MPNAGKFICYSSLFFRLRLNFAQPSAYLFLPILLILFLSSTKIKPDLEESGDFSLESKLLSLAPVSFQHVLELNTLSPFHDVP